MMQDMDNEFGYFDAENREYIITRPDTPRPWFNYLMNEDFVSMISNTGGGPAYYKDPRIYRLLRYRYRNVPHDRPGRYIYIRDNETQKYWSATWAPVWTDGGKYSCRVGMNYQIISYQLNGIASEITYFVPSDRPLEIWDVRIKNVSDKQRDISTFSYAEFAFWGAMRDLMNLDNCPNVSRQKYDPIEDSIVHFSYNDIGTGLHDMRFVQNYGFHTSDTQSYAYNGDRDSFIGIYHDERDPQVVISGESTNYCENGGHPIGCFEHRFNLVPGESRRIIFQTGYAENEDAYRETIVKYKNANNVDHAFSNLKQTWNERLSKFLVRTPDEDFNTIVNSFIQYQSAMTLILSRSICSYNRGIGRAVGFRDSCQDQIGMMHAMPERSKEMIIKLLSAMYEDGSAAHNSNTFTGEYSSNGFYDDHNWIALTITSFVKETGDFNFMFEKFTYCKSDKSGTVLDHLLKANDYAWSLRGKNGLMQTGGADWNDSLNPGDKQSESIFTSMLFCASTKALIEWAKYVDDNAVLEKLQPRYDEIKSILNDVGWDGRWYKRMIKTDGLVLGGEESAAYDIATIFLEPQPWSVISEVADRQKALAALDAIEEKAGTEFGHRVMDKGFTTYNPDIGSVGIFPAGIKENASVFNHASSWMIYAEALLGRGNKAFEYFTRMSGTTKNRIAATHEIEPYVACQFVSQKPFHIVGRGRNGWLTGTASWMAIGSMQGILGCSAEYDGLIVNPSIPSSWKEFSILREFRKVRYNIIVENPDAVEHGVSHLVYKGREIERCKIPFESDDIGKQVDVKVIMGKIA